jgi:DNA repair protein RecO (recombination protein O)
MLYSTQGIVLHSIKFSDTSMVVRILTRNFGLQSYLVQGVRKKGSKVKANLFQHLNLVEMVVWHKETQGLQRIKEIKNAHLLMNMGGDIRKSALAMFLSEMLLNAFHHHESQPEAFDFIFKGILKLELLEKNLSSFHIIFLLQLTRFLGFAPSEGYSNKNCCFNLTEGIYEANPNSMGKILSPEESACFFQLSQSTLTGDYEVPVPAALRRTLLQHIVIYYRLHIEGFKEIKSLEILESVFQ